MRSHRRPSRARRILAAGLVAVLVPALTGAGVALGAAGAVRGRSFATKLPKGWHERTTTGPKSSRTYALTSRGRADVVSIPPRGATSVSIYETPLKALKLEHATAAQVLKATVGVPTVAKDATRGATGTTVLDGTRAATTTYRYSYKGRSIVQRDTATAHAGYAIVVETDADAAGSAAALDARGIVQRGWRWR